MIIGVNTRFLLKGKMEGFGWFTYETMSRVVNNNPQHTFVFFFDRKYDKSFIFSDNVKPVVLFPPTRHIKIFDYWFNVRLTKALKKHKCDAFIAPDGFLSLKTDLPQLAVIHDLNFEHFPEDLPKSVSKYYKTHFPAFAKKAERILTVSKYSKNDIVEKYNISPEKIDVAWNGVNERFSLQTQETIKKTRNKYSDGEPYILFVGAIHKRKNLSRLLEAFDEVKSSYNKPIKLLIVGEELWSKNVQSRETKYKPDILFTGHLEADELAKVYGAATIFAYVSYFEGFGIPLVEAMKSGVPVLSGDKTSLPEVGGDAVHYCDPFSVEDIAKQLLELLENQKLRQSLTEKGMERAKLFSWDNTAKKLWESFERMVGLSE